MSSYAFGNPFINPDEQPYARDTATVTTASSPNLTPSKKRSVTKFPDMNNVIVERGSVSSFADIFKK